MRVVLLIALICTMSTEVVLSITAKKGTAPGTKTSVTRRAVAQHKVNKPVYKQQSRSTASHKFVFFWQVSNDVRLGKTRVVDKSCLSQWYPSEFKVYNITFYSAEQFMMYCKARYFNDSDSGIAILETKDPQEVKGLGKKITPFDDQEWSQVAEKFVLLGNVEKFRQNPHLKKYLLSTGNSILAEASPLDKIWGIGLKENDPRALDQRQWQGTNKLGSALMTVRERLKKNDNPYQGLFGQAGQFTGLITNIKNYDL